jgi:hypothetical protein
MAHLKKQPTWFVKDGKRRKAFFTVEARELIADGWKEEGAKAEPAPPSKPLPEILVEAGTDAFDDDSIKESIGERLEEMTKAELIGWAAENGGTDINPYSTKAVIFAKCKELEAAVEAGDTAEEEVEEEAEE